MRAIIESTVKPSIKFDGGKWFTPGTLSKAIKAFYKMGDNQYLCKGNGISGTQINSICIDKTSRIGKIETIYEDKIIVNIDANKVPPKIIDNIIKGNFEANMRIIINDIDEYTNEIIDMTIICYDLHLL